MHWLPFPDEHITVNGLAWWAETRPHLWRLPARLQAEVPPGVWTLAHSPSGGRLRFATDATTLGLRLHFPSLAYMNNMPRVGQLGVDMWVDGEYWRPVYPTDSADLEAICFADLPATRREICLYLGLYGPVEVQAVGLSEGASLLPPAPFARPRPVVYYGSSITQGGCASRAGMSYQAIVSRELNLDFINLGFSGAGRGEPALARAIAEIDAAAFVMDFCQNCPTLEELAERYSPFLQVIRDHHPKTPLILVTAIFATSEIWGEAARGAGLREIIRAAYRERVAAGDKNIWLVEGTDLLGPGDRDGLLDHIHPNDIGFVSMARGLAPVLREALGLS